MSIAKHSDVDLAKTPFRNRGENTAESNTEAPQNLKRAAQKVLKSVENDHYKKASASMDELMQLMHELVLQRKTGRESPFYFLNEQPENTAIRSVTKSIMKLIANMPAKRSDTLVEKLIGLISNLTRQNHSDDPLSDGAVVKIFDEFEALTENLQQSAFELREEAEVNNEQLIDTVIDISDVLQPLTESLSANISTLEKLNQRINSNINIGDVDDILDALIATINKLPPKRAAASMEQLLGSIGKWIKQISLNSQQYIASNDVIQSIEILTESLKNISNRLRQLGNSCDKQYSPAVSSSFYTLKLLIIRLNTYMYSLKQSGRSGTGGPNVSGLSETLNALMQIIIKMQPEKSEQLTAKLIALIGELGMNYTPVNEQSDLDVIEILSTIAEHINTLPANDSSTLMADLESMMEQLINKSIDSEPASSETENQPGRFNSAKVIRKLQRVTDNLTKGFIKLIPDPETA